MVLCMSKKIWCFTMKRYQKTFVFRADDIHSMLRMAGRIQESRWWTSLGVLSRLRLWGDSGPQWDHLHHIGLYRDMLHSTLQRRIRAQGRGLHWAPEAETSSPGPSLDVNITDIVYVDQILIGCIKVKYVICQNQIYLIFLIHELHVCLIFQTTIISKSFTIFSLIHDLSFDNLIEVSSNGVHIMMCNSTHWFLSYFGNVIMSILKLFSWVVVDSCCSLS